MAKRNWMRLKEMEERHDLNRGHIHTMTKNGTLPKGSVKRVQYPNFKITTPLVDEYAFVRRREFRIKVWDTNHTMYYFLTSTMSVPDLARILETLTKYSFQIWSNWMNMSMFKFIRGSILDYKISMMHWTFYRVCTALIRRMFRKMGVPKDKRDMEVIIMKGVA